MASGGVIVRTLREYEELAVAPPRRPLAARDKATFYERVDKYRQPRRELSVRCAGRDKGMALIWRR